MTNLQGDVVAILDSTGAAVVEYTYDAWGRPLSKEDNTSFDLGDLNPLRYRGYVYDQETGLYYLQSRYYNPTWGRFINADGQLATKHLAGVNLFVYCNNNPVMYSDPYGTAPEWWQWTVSGIAVVAGIALIATGAGGPLGGALICAGVNSIIGSYTNEAAGGSSTAGWVGGGITGLICGAGAGMAGTAFCDATKAVGLACLGQITKGITVSYGLGVLGSSAGTIVSSLMDGKIVNVNDAIKDANLCGILNINAAILAGIGSGIAEMHAISETSKVIAYSLAAFESAAAEAIIDTLSVLISLFE